MLDCARAGCSRWSRRAAIKAAPITSVESLVATGHASGPKVGILTTHEPDRQLAQLRRKSSVTRCASLARHQAFGTASLVRGVQALDLRTVKPSCSEPSAVSCAALQCASSARVALVLVDSW
jgi:hypothetical protein